MCLSLAADKTCARENIAMCDVNIFHGADDQGLGIGLAGGLVNGK